MREYRKCDASHKLQMTNEIEIGWWWWWCCCYCCFGLHVYVCIFWCGLKSLMKKMTKMTTIDVCVRSRVCVCEVIKVNHSKRHITYEATSIIGCQRFWKWVVALWNWICKHQLFFFGHLIVYWMNTSILYILVSSAHSSIVIQRIQCFECACSICSTWCLTLVFSAQFH